MASSHSVPTGPLPTAPWLRLTLLGAAILTLHLLLLGGLDFRLDPPSPALQRPLVTRTVTSTVTAPPAARPQPRPRPAPPVNTPAPEVLPQAPAPATELAAPPTASPAEASDAATAQPDSPPQAAAPPAPPPPPAPLVPGSLRLKYDIVGQVKQFNYSATGELLWRHDGERYEAELEVRLFLLGSRKQTSRGRITPEGLAPTRFSDKVRSEVAAHFEYDKGRVIFSANTPEAPLQPGAQDQLSIFMQIAGLIAAEPQRYPRGATFEMQAVGARESDSWRFVVDGDERLSLPGGEQDTLKLTRTPNRPHDLNVEIWLAPAQGYLPVRIRLTQDNGDYVDQQWRNSSAP